MGYHYRARYEFILFFEKGKRRLNDLGIADVISVPRVHRGLSGGKAAGGLRGPDQSEHRAGRAGGGSVHGIGQRRRRRAARRAPVPRHRSAIRRRSRLTADRLRQFGEGQRAAGSAGRRGRAPRAVGLGVVSGAEYANLIASYLARRFGSRGLNVYREVRARQVDHRQEPLHRRLLRPRRGPHGVRDRVQVPGLDRHGGRKDPLRARRSRGAADGRLHRLRRQGLLRGRAAHARRRAARGVLPARRRISTTPRPRRASWIT